MSWGSFKREYWKRYGPDGKVPRRLVEVEWTSKKKKGKKEVVTESMELHHINGRNCNNPHTNGNVIPLWPTVHAAADRFRNTGYKVLRVINELLD